MSADLYEILGVAPDADEATIKSAFRELAQQYHPDLNPDDPDAEETFKEILAAFEILSDPDQRRQYDRYGLDAVETNHASAATDASNASSTSQQDSGERHSGLGDVFTDVFDGRSPFDTSHMHNFGDFDSEFEDGDDVVETLEIDCLDAVLGREVDLRLDGHSVLVPIPAGAQTGDRLRLEGRGRRPPTEFGDPGDLILELDVREHDRLRRNGLDLELDVPIRIDEAIFGNDIRLPTPHGDVEVTIPAGVSSGATLRLEGLGIRRDDARGDFYAVLEIYTPDIVDESIESAVRTLADGYSESPREQLDL